MEENRVYVSLSGLPLSFELDWPFHTSTSGADFSVLHADIRLESSEGLHAPVAVNLSAPALAGSEGRRGAGYQCIAQRGGSAADRILEIG